MNRNINTLTFTTQEDISFILKEHTLWNAENERSTHTENGNWWCSIISFLMVQKLIHYQTVTVKKMCTHY